MTAATKAKPMRKKALHVGLGADELWLRREIARHGFRAKEIVVSKRPSTRGGGFIAIAQVARVEDDGFRLTITADGETRDRVMDNFDRNITRAINLMRRALNRIQESRGQVAAP